MKIRLVSVSKNIGAVFYYTRRISAVKRPPLFYQNSGHASAKESTRKISPYGLHFPSMCAIIKPIFYHGREWVFDPILPFLWPETAGFSTFRKD